jgi:hypothetical protein
MLAALLLLMADRAELVQGAAGSKSDLLGLHAGGLVLREGEPGAVFAAVHPLKGARQLAYFVAIKHRWPGEGKTESNEEVTVEEQEGSARHHLTLEGRAFPLVYTASVDREGRNLRKETLTAGGKAIDLAKGRVLIVDLTVDPPAVLQRKIELPSPTEDPTSKKAAADLARKALDLILKDKKAREILTSDRR